MKQAIDNTKSGDLGMYDDRDTRSETGMSAKPVLAIDFGFVLSGIGESVRKQYAIGLIKPYLSPSNRPLCLWLRRKLDGDTWFRRNVAYLLSPWTSTSLSMYIVQTDSSMRG